MGSSCEIGSLNKELTRCVGIAHRLASARAAPWDDCVSCCDVQSEALAAYMYGLRPQGPRGWHYHPQAYTMRVPGNGNFCGNKGTA